MNLPSIILGTLIAASVAWCIWYNIRHRECAGCGGNCGHGGCRCQATAERMLADARKRTQDSSTNNP